MPNAIRLPFQFDPENIIRELETFPDDAKWEVMSTYISPKGLFAINLLEPVASAKTFAGDLEMMHSSLLQSAPYLQEIEATLKGKKYLYRVHFLQPYAQIKLHTDGMSPERGRIRIHVPVTGAGKSTFILNGQALSMDPGSCWFLDVSKPHEVQNLSEEVRIHLVLDCSYDSWWEGILHCKSPKCIRPF